MKQRLLTLLGMMAIVCCVCAADVVWYDGRQPVTYRVEGRVAPVVDVAVSMFVGDMEQVTGQPAVSAKDAIIYIYELDKNASAVAKLRKQGVPVDDMAGAFDAFWLGVRDGKVLVVGSNGRGTA